MCVVISAESSRFGFGCFVHTFHTGCWRYYCFCWKLNERVASNTLEPVAVAVWMEANDRHAEIEIECDTHKQCNSLSLWRVCVCVWTGRRNNNQIEMIIHLFRIFRNVCLMCVLFFFLLEFSGLFGNSNLKLVFFFVSSSLFVFDCISHRKFDLMGARMQMVTRILCLDRCVCDRSLQPNRKCWHKHTRKWIKKNAKTCSSRKFYAPDKVSR